MVLILYLDNPNTPNTRTKHRAFLEKCAEIKPVSMQCSLDIWIYRLTKSDRLYQSKTKSSYPSFTRIFDSNILKNAFSPTNLTTLWIQLYTHWHFSTISTLSAASSMTTSFWLQYLIYSARRRTAALKGKQKEPSLFCSFALWPNVCRQHIEPVYTGRSSAEPFMGHIDNVNLRF